VNRNSEVASVVELYVVRVQHEQKLDRTSLLKFLADRSRHVDLLTGSYRISLDA
jgi:hypothetical protein